MKSLLTGNSLANQARMLRSVFQGTILFVEGSSDERLYGMFVDAGRCKIIICHGRTNLFDACANLTASFFVGFLGIADADFEHLHERPSPPDVFYTDFHDAEAMMLQSGSFSRIINELASKEKLAARGLLFPFDALREFLVTESLHIGFLLLHSNNSNQNLTFKTIEFREFTDKSTLTIERDSLIRHIKNKSNNHLPNNQLLSNAIDLLLHQYQSVDKWQIARGHDICKMIGFALQYALGSESSLDTAFDKIERYLRLGFSFEEFAQTRLYQSVRVWERDHPPFMVFQQPI